MEKIKLAGERDPEGKHNKKGEEEGHKALRASGRDRRGGTAHFIALIGFVICLISKPQRFDFLPRAAIHLTRNKLCSRLERSFFSAWKIESSPQDVNEKI
jgi:hypothetical protein